jgi:hypothetical protein
MAFVTMIALVKHSWPSPKIPISRHPIFIGMIVLFLWICLQSLWAVDSAEHAAFVTIYFKFIIAFYLFYRCLQTPEQLAQVMWVIVAGGAYAGLIAFQEYDGGRFEDSSGAFGGEANATALAMVIALLFAGGLFLRGAWKTKAAVVLAVPFLANGLVTTISRSGFLSLATGILIFNWFTPKKYRLRVSLLSLLGVVVFVSFTNDAYWERIGTIAKQGAKIEGVDTGSNRLEIMKGQLKMIADYPAGCGHHCTAALAPKYMPPTELSTFSGTRASHNTFMSAIVDHGWLGAALYLLLALWIVRTSRQLLRNSSLYSESEAPLIPAVAGALIASLIADQFVPYERFEPRYWMLSFAIALLALQRARMLTDSGPKVASMTTPPTLQTQPTDRVAPAGRR